MPDSEVFIYIGGILTLLMAVFHTRFYRLFLWGSDFAKITERNRRILYTVHIALLLLFFILGAISLVYTKELAGAKGLARGILLGFVIFWFWRTVWQPIYFRPSRIKRFRPLLVMHYIMTAWFLLLFIVYLIPLIMSQ
jgi:hypothetical protein